MAETGESLQRLRRASFDTSGRLEPQLLRAAEDDNVDLLRQIIDFAKVKGQLSDNFLRIGLMRSSEKGKLNATRYLLERGAPANGAQGNRLSPLLLAVERHDTSKEKVESLHSARKEEKRNNIPIIQLLLEYKADLETVDKKGRTALMTAAWKNHFHILQMLIREGADVNAKDKRGRNVLHNLAADKPNYMNWGDDVLNLLFDQKIHIDGPDGRDELGRTPLHWACATGKVPLAQRLLTKGAQVEASEVRMKTCLHLAASHDREDMVELLLSNDANVNARSDGGWTPLHNACEKGRENIVRVLLSVGADINAKLLNGMTSLHLAAQEHITVVKILLEREGIKRATRDNFGITPFLRAAQNKEKDIMGLLAPFNNLETMSEDALGACNGFNATIVDFGNFKNGNRVNKRSVFEVLYGRDPVNRRKPAIEILPNEKAVEFRWVHLPANNMAWVEALLTKLFIEEGASDIEGFKALEKSFSHQHRGQQSHSHFMRPLCQSCPRAPRTVEVQDVQEHLAEQTASQNNNPVIIINGGPASPPVPRTPVRSSTSGESDWVKSSPRNGGKEHGRGSHKDKGKKLLVHAKGSKSPKGVETPTKEYFKPHQHADGKRGPSPAPLSKKDAKKESRKKETIKKETQGVTSKGNIFTFMPYLHFESTQRRQEMQEAIKCAEKMKSNNNRKPARAKTYDEMLIRAHLATSTTSLHVRRTLDQSFYHNIDTESRDQDQVVYRYQLRGKDPKEEIDPKIVMVDQLWMWILGKDLIVTSFPQRWQQPKNDPLNVLDSIIEDINSKIRDPCDNVYDLSTIITSRCSGVFDRHRTTGSEEYQFLDMFESSIGSATDRETVLFKQFNLASTQASAWLQQNRRPNRFSRFASYKSLAPEEKEGAKQKNRDLKEEKFKLDEIMQGPDLVDTLLNISQESDLLAETKDIRDELNMIEKVLEDQQQVIPNLENFICELYLDEQKAQTEVKKRFREQLKTIEMHIKDIKRMDKQAERIYKSITDMLDLKQKHANAFEARFAREQAAGTARQTQTIILFTIVTIIFLPLSFIASFFAIPMSEFPHQDGNLSLPLGYVSRYTFGIGFAISIPLIAIALNLGDILDIIQAIRRRLNQRAQRRRKEAELSEYSKDDNALMTMRLEQAISIAKSGRKSVDSQWMRDVLMNNRPGTANTEGKRERVATGFRMRMSHDVERGMDLHEARR